MTSVASARIHDSMANGGLSLSRLPGSADEVDECSSRRVDAGVVVGGDEIEQQAADDGQTEACKCRIDGSVYLGQPCVDGPRQHACVRLLALRASRVALEEQSLERTQLGAANVGPHRGDSPGRGGGQVGEEGHLAALNLLDDR